MTFETKFRSFVGLLKKRELTPTEQTIWADELLRLYNEERRVDIDGWKGKSSFEFKEVGDYVLVKKYQKPERGAEPKEINYKIPLWELRRIESMIKDFFEKNKEEYLKSKDLATSFYEMTWDEIFTNRKIHNRFTIILNVLDKENIIDYRGGRVRLIEDGKRAVLEQKMQN